MAELVFDLISDFFFDKISFISFPFTQTRQIYYVETDGLSSGSKLFPWGDSWNGSPMQSAGVAISTTDYVNTMEGPVTDTVRYWGISRIPNTSEGKFLSPGKRSRMRCSFYCTNANQLDGYLLSPVSYDSFSQLNYFTSMSVFRAYVGLKFLGGKVSVAIKEVDKEERLIPVDVDVAGSGSSTTYRLEIICNGKETTFFVDGISLGTYSSDFTTGFEGINNTFLPLLSPARSLNGSQVGITIENYQFIQDN